MATFEQLGLNNLLYRDSSSPDTNTVINADGSTSSVSATSGLISDNSNSQEINPDTMVSGDLNGNIFINDGFLRSKGFVAGASGWTINADGSAEFSNGVFRGNISSSTINIPNSTTPLFTVDSLGNVTASSLRRKDFHWYTVFESLDGYDKGADAGGSAVLELEGIELTTVATNTKEAYAAFQKSYMTGFSWSKKRAIKICLKPNNNFTNNEIFECGALGSNFGTCQGIGFRVSGKVLYGISGDGSNESVANLGSFDSGATVHNYSIEYDATTGCKFYVDDVYKGATSTYLPTGTSTAGCLFLVNLKTLENVSKTMVISYYDFWQQL